MFVSIGEISEIIGVSVGTIRRWEKLKLIACSFRTLGNHRRFDVNRVKNFLGIETSELNRKVIAYARVSSHDQKDDLVRQASRLEEYCSKQFANADFELIKDLGSGLNFKKRGLKKLIREILAGKVSEIVLTHKDRLLRFGSELIFLICACLGTKIRLIEEEQNLSGELVLAKDALEIITVFSARLYGKRSHQNRKNKLAQQKRS